MPRKKSFDNSTLEGSIKMLERMIKELRANRTASALVADKAESIAYYAKNLAENAAFLVEEETEKNGTV